MATVEEKTKPKSKPTAEAKLADFLIEQITAVGSGQHNMAVAKNRLAEFWKSLSHEERTELYNGNNAIAVATKVKHYAEALTSEMPLLLAQYSREE